MGHVPIVKKRHPMLPGPAVETICARCDTKWPCEVSILRADNEALRRDALKPSIERNTPQGDVVVSQQKITMVTGLEPPHVLSTTRTFWFRVALTERLIDDCNVRLGDLLDMQARRQLDMLRADEKREAEAARRPAPLPE